MGVNIYAVHVDQEPINFKYTAHTAHTMQPKRKLDKSIRISSEARLGLWKLKSPGATYDQVIEALLLYRGQRGGVGGSGLHSFDAILAEVTK